jgi:hypothetical protein
MSIRSACQDTTFWFKIPDGGGLGGMATLRIDGQDPESAVRALHNMLDVKAPFYIHVDRSGQQIGLKYEF